MSALERVARFGDRVFDRMRDKRAFTVTEDKAIDGGFDSLRDHKYAVIVTFRRNGDAVPSPVWFGLGDNGHVYVQTAQHAGKVKRLRHDSRVLMAPSNARGKPVGPAIRGTGRLLPKEEWGHAEQTVAARYGSSRRISRRLLAGEDLDAYVEITPGR